jgi:putative phage-type endonuclease
MIQKEDIIDYINSNYKDALYNLHLYKKSILEDLIDLFNNVSDNKNDIQINAEKYFIESIIDEYSDKMITFYDRKFKLDGLMKLDLPEQRSPEWHEMRRNILTASSFAAALDKCHFTSRDQLLYDKIVPAPYESNPITEWGVKYEEIATLFYQLITGTTVKEFGLIPHPTFPIFGASPDGICDDTGPTEFCARMLEIKCPPKRKFTKSVPEHYWMQMQGQLEVCDLDECDFLQVKLDEYDNFTDYKNDVLDLSNPLKYSYPDINNYDETINGKTSDNLPKGCTISYSKEDDSPGKLSYIYPKLLLSDDEYLEWIDEHIKQGYNIVETKWWKITRYELSTVNRDKNWWNGIIEHVLKFYNDYIHYKDNPKELAKLKERNEKKPKYKYKKKEIDIVPPKLPEFALCDMD